jgi:hypothetical protein
MSSVFARSKRGAGDREKEGKKEEEMKSDSPCHFRCDS